MSKYQNKELDDKTYSLIGKISFQKYPILIQKDKILKGIQKTHKIKDLFTPDEQKKNDKIEEYYTLFRKYQMTTKENRNALKKKKSKIEFVCKLMKNNPKLVYHNRHLYSESRKKLTIESDNFSYAPKYDYIRPRLLSGPSWKNTNDKKDKKISIDKRDYYIGQKDFLKNSESKCLVNMNRTTQRGEFINDIDIRIRNEKSFDRKKIKKSKNKKYKSVAYFLNLSNKNKDKDKDKINNKMAKTTRDKNTSDNEEFKSNEAFSKTFNNFNFKIKLKTKKKFFEEEKNKMHKRNINLSINNISENKKKNRTLNILSRRKKSIKNNAPDFKKIISREQVEKAKGKKFTQMPIIIPNYTLVKERPLAMAIYKKFSKHKINNPKSKNIEGIDYKIQFDPDKFITKYNNHLKVQGPNFNSMLSRNYYEKKSTLPSYMNNIYDRGSMYRITEKALKMNKFKEGKISPASSTFLPKKSFNKIINLNIINSHDFNEKINDEFIDEKKEILKTEIERKNREDELDLLKDLGLLSQFDNFSYKTITVEKKNSDISHNKYPKNWIKKSIKDIFSICY